MADILNTLHLNLITPTILFFFLGIFAGGLKSDLAIPDVAAKFMSIYLLFAIGFKGGVSFVESPLTPDLAFSAIAAVVLSFIIPVFGYLLLRVLTALDKIDAAAVAGHYGSISIVTFVTAVSVLENLGYDYEGYMVAVAAIMEAPAIFSALWLARGTRSLSRPVLREIALNGSLVLLLGSFVIGIITGTRGMAEIGVFISSPFTGILCLFLLDMGLKAGRNIFQSRHQVTTGLIVFGFAMPLFCAAIGAVTSLLIGLSLGGTFLMMVLCASASYIAVPAALRLALPDSNATIPITLSLGVTFPFNISLGLTLYLLVAEYLHKI